MEETAQKEESAAFAKSNIPLGYMNCRQRNGHLNKKMTTMPPGNEEKKDSVKACVLTVAHIEVISTCVIPV